MPLLLRLDAFGARARGDVSGLLLQIRRAAIVLVLLLVYLLGVPLYHWTKIDKVDAAPTGDRPADQPGTNYLIVGSDKADDLTAAQRKALDTPERGGTNTDTIIVLHTGSGGRTMMSIPRDTLVEVPDGGTQMINAAFASGGAPLLVERVEVGPAGAEIQLRVAGLASLVRDLGALDPAALRTAA